MSSDRPRLITTYLAEWLARHHEAAALAPDVEQARAFAEWQDKAYADLERYLSPSMRAIHEARFEVIYKQVQDALPMPPTYGPTAGTTVTSAVATGTMGTYGFAIGLRSPGLAPPEAAALHIASYERLQASQHRAEVVRSLLDGVAPALATQFDRAQNELLVARTDPERTAPAALEIRTLLDNLQGELFAKACAGARDNMTWDIMVTRLARPEPAQTSAALLREQQAQRSDLLNDLSELAKRRPGARARELSELWPLVLEHIYVVCSNVR